MHGEIYVFTFLQNITDTSNLQYLSLKFNF